MWTLDEANAFFAKDLYALKQSAITIENVSEEGATCLMSVTPLQRNANGFAQGGAIFTLCDFAFAVAANASGTPTVSQTCSISYLRPGAGARLTAIARIVNESRQTCLGEVRVTDERGKLVAVMTATGFHVSQREAAK